MLRLLDGLFWTFLIATVLHVVFFVIVPTPDEWPGTFPYNIPSKWWAPFLRHLSLFPQHFPVTRFIDIINGAFLTMFVYKIRVDVRVGIGNGDGNGNVRVASSTYVDWAIGALLSGIIFASSRLFAVDNVSKVIVLSSIFIFSFVSYYFLYRLRQKLRIEEEKSKVESVGET